MDLDELAEGLESMILEDAKKVFSETVIEYAYNPRNVGVINNADGVGKLTGTCGDTVQISIRVENSKITKSMFISDGCGTSIACGSMLTEMIKDKTIEEALMINSNDLLRSLDGLPEEYVHCTVLAVNVLQAAIDDYKKKFT
ncbi:MAG: iron-sulfur cluster assembly scaffold protein [Methanosarcinales archaeon]|nr:iron-sulfur cluster assembly scaffold protein [Methanosarcinales archaeon]